MVETIKAEARQTALLPPFTAVRLAWALTGKFSQEEGSQDIAALAERVLTGVHEKAESSLDTPERQYIVGAVTTIQASLRTLDTIYKGRQLNFQENEKLREAYLDTIKENLEFGRKAQDVLKSLPTMTVTTAAGVVGVSQLVALPTWQLWLVGAALAGAGYILNLFIVRFARRRQQQLYVEQDYERNLYYDQYVTRVRTALVSLYLDLDRIHANAFGQPYPISTAQKVQDIVEDTVKGIRGTMCPYVHKHTREKKVTPELWPRCETGGAGTRYCQLWEGAPPPPEQGEPTTHTS